MAGANTVMRKMGLVTYENYHPDKRKTRQTYHVYHAPSKKDGSLRVCIDFCKLTLDLQVLTNLLSKSVTNPVPWTNDCKKAFKTLKEKMCSSPVLHSPDFSKRFLVQVDASATGIGAVLAQGNVKEQKTIVFLSRKLLPRETRYSAIEKAGLAIKWSLDSLGYYLLGREFDLETDHRALTWIQSMKDHNARVTRWYLALQPYHFKIRHRPGRLNVVADYLSRFPASMRLGEGEGDVIKSH